MGHQRGPITTNTTANGECSSKQYRVHSDASSDSTGSATSTPKHVSVRMGTLERDDQGVIHFRRQGMPCSCLVSSAWKVTTQLTVVRPVHTCQHSTQLEPSCKLLAWHVTKPQADPWLLRLPGLVLCRPGCDRLPDQLKREHPPPLPLPLALQHLTMHQPTYDAPALQKLEWLRRG